MGLSSLAGLAFPWDLLEPAKARAAAHPDGIVDLSVGTPVDATPDVVRRALESASDAHGYPLTAGTPALRAAVAGWFARRRGVTVAPDATLPTVGSKELVGLLPSMLGLGAGDTVVHPAVAYPTYDVGARLAGATSLATDDVRDWDGREGVRLVWVNSPGNPHGRVADVAELRAVVEAARRTGAVVVSDECYAELGWGDGPHDPQTVPSLLDPRVCGDDHTNLLVTYSLSKQSSMAGYRAAFVAGDPALVGALLGLRKQLGLIVPGPVQAAMVAALDDDEHVAVQRESYRARRDLLGAALTDAGFVIDHSEAGLYLWVRPAGERVDCWATVDRLAQIGLLVAPGAFYGAAGEGHVRVALTVTDERAEAAANRLSTLVDA
ncbi:succinyldiaminopimelate transaminase [Sanguibacter sp. HDW7]|uniref:succinyldiaminopimelate transaminase n=1 Tax=Sanguibacter sp. HDW7 TaxID=2714931 RepID=UPI00140865FC|nr:succinyldiaminopimelate transaminase [Sanguibacter sp. HDW7]QIK84027.1 succinyldiaminopimelate transaminase [Sanguibacter sp. HDW7]